MIIIWGALTVGIFILDLFVKNRVEKYNAIKGSVQKEKKILGDSIILKRYHNHGAFLNLGERKSTVVAVLSVLLSLMVTGLFVISLGSKGSHLLHAGLSLLLGGAYSNTYDRIKRKYVVDYFSFNVKWSKLRGIVFNLSDFCIMLGAMLAVIGSGE